MKSRVLPTGERMVVEFDGDCPDELAYLGLPFMERLPRMLYKANDEWRWPADMTQAEREAAVRKTASGTEIVQRVPVVERDSPCFNCTRGGTTAVSQETRVPKAKRASGRRIRRKG